MTHNSSSIYLVFDIGKTNKKALYYSPSLDLLEKRSCQIDIIYENNLEIEDIEKIQSWLEDEILVASQHHTIDGIALSCHGATFALLDKNDQLSYPVLSYSSEVGKENNDSFYETYGSPKELQLSTSSPDLGFVNLGKQIHYIKTNARQAWDASLSFLFFSQYLGFLLTNEKSMEVSYLGNHSFMWDFQKSEYSQFTKDSGLIDKISLHIRKPYETLGNVKPELKSKLNISYEIPVTVGIHDSNASILPYLANEKDDFTLLSTGTWCVGLKPNQQYELSDGDLQTKTFYNLDANGKPLRTSISPIGYEYEEYSKLVQVKDPNQIVETSKISQLDLVIIPGILESTSIFADSQPGVYTKGEWFPFQQIKNNPEILKSINAEELYLALNISLAIQTTEQLNRLNTDQKESVYIEGGFINNQTYLSCLKSLNPNLVFKQSNLQEATAYGAAITITMAKKLPTHKELQELIQYESNEIKFENLPSLEEYSKHYFNILGDQNATTTRSN
ncbi:MAG: hypothetical protein COA79_06395 [Planctomycetota bacterium]|nr:MAG: hypothetical protein COA79_06395 [Planctomycetota bacterium]